MTAASIATGQAGNRAGLHKRHPWLPLLWQILVLIVLIAAVFVYLGLADLTDTERSTLAPAELWGMTLEHLQLTFLGALIVVVIGVPLGILLTRGSMRKISPGVVVVANFGQAAPAIGVVVLLAMWLGFGAWPATIALVLYALLPVLSNTMVGLDGVDKRLIEAGRGMGMSAGAVLLKVELPLAVPVMLSGIRTALVLLVGTASLGTFVNAGGLGLLINTGITLSQGTVLVVGSLLVALLALVIDWIGRVVEYVARPKGL
ncbi:ABC transporter permease [Galactobacter sp.]|uniref:ABC transporter permease n=1 Tax=Galactobacter sp. TaxID=2676125 RepID=UPI0025BFD0F5|nr:ABC transporter permease [Galactobacter sp.]